MVRPARGAALVMTILTAASFAALGGAASELSDSHTQTQGRSAACSGDLCISELLPDALQPSGQSENGPVGSSYENGEWVEVTNRGLANIDMTGYYLTDDDTTHILTINQTHIVLTTNPSNSMVLNPGGHAVIANDGVSSKCGFCLRNSGEEIQLFNPSNLRVHHVTYNSSSSGKTLTEDPADSLADWGRFQTSNSPGGPNGGGTTITYYQSDVLISELMIDAPGRDNATRPGGEWIELYNNGSADVDISGWKFRTHSGSTLTIDEDHIVGWDPADSQTHVIAPGERTVVWMNGTSLLVNTQSGGTTPSIQFILPNGSLTEPLSWAQAQRGMSKALDPQGTHSLVDTALASPGSTNIYTVSDAINGTDTNVQLSEIRPDPSSASNAAYPDGEWVEISVHADNLNLGDYALLDTSGVMHAINLSNIVNDDGDLLASKDEHVIIEAHNSTFELGNYLGGIFVMASDGTIIDGARWDTSEVYSVDRSLIRNETNDALWRFADFATPGLNNSIMDAIEPGTVLINEVMPNPFSADSKPAPNGEWIELHNNGTDPVNLTGWSLIAGGFSIIDIDEGSRPNATDQNILQPDEYMLVWRNGSAFRLGNAAEQLALRDSFDRTVDMVTWIADNQSIEGIAYVRSEGNVMIKADIPTPGRSNTFPEYTGSTSLIINEIGLACDTPIAGPSSTWVELLNTGNEAINLSRWMVSIDGEISTLLPQFLWPEPSYDLDALTIEAGSYMVIGLRHSDWLEYAALFDPDGDLVENGTIEGRSWSCYPVVRSENGFLTGFVPTPGSANPDLSGFRTSGDVLITRFMPRPSSDNEVADEFIELANVGDGPVSLAGWTLRRVGEYQDDVRTENKSFPPVLLESGERVQITEAAEALAVTSGQRVLDATELFGWMSSIYDDNSALQLFSEEGTMVDSVVYGEKPGGAEMEGWNGSAISIPRFPMDGIVLLRGSGCAPYPDTDTADDWYAARIWTHSSITAFCGQTFDSSGSITPVIGPEEGLPALLTWISEAQTELHVHVYQLSEPSLVAALAERAQGGVEVTVVLDESPVGSDSYDYERTNSIINLLLDAGVTVRIWGDDGAGDDDWLPGRYNHAKIAVRDGESVFIGSGNWKSSSFPIPGESGNREWNLIIDDSTTADAYMERLLVDENSAHPLVSAARTRSSAGEFVTNESYQVPANFTPSTPLSGDFSARVLTCPDDCLHGMLDAINGAQTSIHASLASIDDSWVTEGSPLVDALRTAAERGVELKVLLDGNYIRLDGGSSKAIETRAVIQEMNEGWGLANVEARIMADSENTWSLHNKGLIIDAETVLVGSINWNDNAILRNREQGILVTMPTLAAYFETSFSDDWNLLDEQTDTDSDGMTDRWEIENGFNRSISSVPGSNLNEGEMDADGDGLTNREEHDYGGDPRDADTDDDCIRDGLEKTLAAQSLGVLPKIAITTVDVDGDGTPDGEEYGCELELTDIDTTTPDVETVTNTGTGNTTVPQTNGTTSDDTNSKQNADANLSAEEGPDDSNGLMTVFIVVISISTLAILASIIVILTSKPSDEEMLRREAAAPLDFTNMPDTFAEQTELGLPQVRATSGAPRFDASQSDDPLASQDPARLQKYLDSGWTREQLTEYVEDGRQL